MKIRIIILILLLWSSKIFAQSNEHKIFSNDISNLSKSVNEKKWSEICDLIYPKVFTLMSRDNVLILFEQSTNMGIEVNTKFKGINTISKEVKSRKEKFRKINYNALLTLTLTGLMSYSQDLITPNLELEFGKRNIKYIESLNTYIIKIKRNMYAISNINSKDWHYIDIDSKFLAKNKTLIPFDIKQKLD